MTFCGHILFLFLEEDHHTFRRIGAIIFTHTQASYISVGMIRGIGRFRVGWRNQSPATQVQNRAVSMALHPTELCAQASPGPPPMAVARSQHNPKVVQHLIIVGVPGWHCHFAASARGRLCRTWMRTSWEACGWEGGREPRLEQGCLSGGFKDFLIN